jgi:glycosyltransferase involved in cell wall biosynthesis
MTLGDDGGPDRATPGPVFLGASMKQRVVIIGASFAMGGGDRFTHEAANALHHAGHDVLVVTTLSATGLYRDQLDAAIPVKQIAHEDDIIGHTAGHDPDVILINGRVEGVKMSRGFWRCCPRLRRVSALIHVTHKLGRYRRRWMEGVTDILSVSPTLAGQIGVQFKKPFGVLPPFVDLDRFKPATRDLELMSLLDWPSDAQVVFYSGRLDEQKLPSSMAEVFCAASQHNPRLRLLIVGGPDDLCGGETARRAARCLDQFDDTLLRYGDESLYHVTGSIPDPERYYTLGDVFILTSHYEGLPLALLEATAMGKQAVLTDVGAVRDVAEPMRFRIVRRKKSDDLCPSEVGAFAAAINQALSSRPLLDHVRQEGPRFIESHYSLAKFHDAVLRWAEGSP